MSRTWEDFLPKDVQGPRRRAWLLLQTILDAAVAWEISVVTLRLADANYTLASVKLRLKVGRGVASRNRVSVGRSQGSAAGQLRTASLAVFRWH